MHQFLVVLVERSFISTWEAFEVFQVDRVTKNINADDMCPKSVFTDDIQKRPQQMPSKDHAIPGVSLCLSQRVSFLLVDSCLKVEK